MLRILLTGLLLLTACQGSDPASDAGLDSSWQGDAPLDVGMIPDAEPMGPPPVAPIREAERIELSSWSVTRGSNPGWPDPVLDALEAGTLDLTDPAISWRSVTPGENGVLDAPWRSTYWAAVQLPSDGVEGIIARAGHARSVHQGSARQPGDPYNSRKSRIPVLLNEGDSVVAVRANPQRGLTEIELWRTEDELYFNLADTTFPHLRVGDESELYLGVPILNLTHRAALETTARVVENDFFHETTLSVPALSPGAATQVAFHLRPKAAWAEAEMTVPVTIRVESRAMNFSYERVVELQTIAADQPFRRTLHSRIDGSAQYYGVRPPADFDAARDYALVLSLHGASVEAIGQARSYHARDWAYVVAPTNRRPFGFDWEEWGRLDGIEVLEHAQSSYRIDPTQVYLTGHSMGGHGTWQFGVHFPGRFAVVGPSAGWSSFYSYGGRSRPGSPFSRSQRSSETNDFLTNLSERAVYILHGGADDNVPTREGRDMYTNMMGITESLTYHEEPGMGHWWNGDRSPGVDCVDWPPLFELMQSRRLDPTELEFDFICASPRVNPTHSYVTIESGDTPYRDITLASRVVSDTELSLTTTNARGLRLDGSALMTRGISRISVDGMTYDVTEGDMPIGPQDGKTSDVHGPFNQVFARPFCFVYPDGEEGRLYQEYGANLISRWQLIGNGHACAMPLSALTAAVRSERNIIYLGVNAEIALEGANVPLAWDASKITLQGREFPGTALAATYRVGDRLSGIMYATAGRESELYDMAIFHSGFALPDFTIWGSDGIQGSGFFDATWGAVASPSP